MRARSTLAALGAAAVLLVVVPAASAAIAYTPCTPTGFQCGQLAVPLDRTGAVPGTLTLSIKRVVASADPTGSAVVALAGGPGQAALPAATELATILGPALAQRDLLVFDQRGTGASNRLRCNALEDAGAESITDAAAACARQLGPARGFYRTADSVDDIEAIRVESGYQKLVLFGVSYGTKVAEDYAAKYPANVEALVLDSVVPPEGVDVLNVATFKALPRVLGELCGHGLCHGITTSVNHDLVDVAHRAAKIGAGGRSGLTGRVNTPSGREIKAQLDRDALFEILLGGDLNPTLRAELPGALRSTLRGDRRPLLRLALRAYGLTGVPIDARAATDTTSDSDALYYATRCEESVFPWERGAGTPQRKGQADAAAQAHPASDFGAFGWGVAERSDVIPSCLAWPNASAPPAPPAPLPQVPTLIVSGGADVRTPLEDAQAVAARIPGAQVLSVPYVGHSVLSTDFSDCAKHGLAAFFAGQPIAPCADPKPLLAPTPVAPTRLSRVPGRTKARKTVAAVSDTVGDIALQFVGDAIAEGRLPAGSMVAGLRSGHATSTATGFELRRVEFVSGVVVSGHVPQLRGTARLTVRGADAAHGRLEIHPGGRVTGTLDGHKVSVQSARAARAVDRALGVRVPRYRRRLQLG